MKRCGLCRRTPLGLVHVIHGRIYYWLFLAWIKLTPLSWSYKVDNPTCGLAWIDLDSIGGRLFCNSMGERTPYWPCRNERDWCAQNNHFIDVHENESPTFYMEL